MKRYIVEITDEALRDMEQIYDYIANILLSPENAIGQYDRIANAILTLDTFPERFRVLDTKKAQLSELRRMLVDNYSVFFMIINDKVRVTNVLYSASDIEKRLK